MKTSVIVATYNRPDYLERVVRAYFDQSVLPDELIVADDGSGPSTRSVVEKLVLDAPFKVVHAWHEDKGFRVAAARNNALRLSSGDYIISTDGDCIPCRQFVADHLRLIQQGTFVQGKRILVTEKGVSKVTGREGLVALFRCWLRGWLRKPHLFFRLPGVAVRKNGVRGVRGCNSAFFREDLVKINGWNEDYVGWGREDTDLVVRLMKSGCARRDAMFSAIVYHLWHDKNNHGRLALNDELLKKTWEGPFRVPNGMEKEGS